MGCGGALESIPATESRDLRRCEQGNFRAEPGISASRTETRNAPGLYRRESDRRAGSRRNFSRAPREDRDFRDSSGGNGEFPNGLQTISAADHQIIREWRFVRTRRPLTCPPPIRKRDSAFILAHYGVSSVACVERSAVPRARREAGIQTAGKHLGEAPANDDARGVHRQMARLSAQRAGPGTSPAMTG